jgi:putative oxidoreductase
MKSLFGNFLSGRWAVGLLLLRAVTGAAFALHGWMKITGPVGMFHWGDGMGIPKVFQFLAVAAEFGGGLGLIVGLLTPIASFGIICTMLVALFKVHLPAGHPFVSMGGPSYELAAVYLANALAILLLGPGAFSLDALIFGRRLAPTTADAAADRQV